SLGSGENARQCGLHYLRSHFVENIPHKVLDSLRRTSTLVQRIEYLLERQGRGGKAVTLWMLLRRLKGNLLHRTTLAHQLFTASSLVDCCDRTPKTFDDQPASPKKERAKPSCRHMAADA